MRTVGIGHQDFATIREQDYFYVDKTDFIREWWDGGDSVTLITRPRRFGKTLNLSMLECFFSLRYAGRVDLFDGLKIWTKECFRRVQGTYPVIFLSFAGVKENRFPEARASICHLIENAFDQYRELWQGDLLNEREKSFCQKVCAEMSDSVAVNSLNMLAKCLFRYYGKKVIVLLDEYDTPMQEAYLNGYWEEMAVFMRSLFNCTFKTNTYLERAVMTGITRISKESIFSDLNNIKVITTTSEKYRTSFGFTEEEVFASLGEYDLEDRKGLVKDWYDGFTFGSASDIYNPWSIINYLSTGKLGTYWANTSSNSLVGKLIRQGNVEIKTGFERLFQGDILEAEIDEQIVFDQLDTRRGALWSLLLACGYLKVVRYFLDEQTGEEKYFLSLTNREVQIMFRRMVRDWFYQGQDSYNFFIKALLAGDVEAMNEYMNRVALATFSYFDVGSVSSEREEPERFYHGFVLGLIAELEDRYVITSNRESGFGRYDVMLEPRSGQLDAIVLEFKVHQPGREADLEETVKNALTQIEERRYGEALAARGIAPQRIRCYGFAFRGKEVRIGEGSSAA